MRVGGFVESATLPANLFFAAGTGYRIIAVPLYDVMLETYFI